jgi:hypothetical protein
VLTHRITVAVVVYSLYLLAQLGYYLKYGVEAEVAQVLAVVCKDGQVVAEHMLIKQCAAQH